ncbi:MAG TPA: hypothetical protein VH092_20600 [Urbifossiella sp.]|nr:hypothetical protein [Urbifossiella sp.]
MPALAPILDDAFVAAFRAGTLTAGQAEPDVVVVVRHLLRRHLRHDRRVAWAPGPRPVLRRGVRRGAGE